MGLEFRKSYYIGYLICENTSYNYHTRSSKSNEIEWIGITNHYYSLGHNPPSNSIVLCRTCRQSPTCLNLYNSQIYFAFKSKNLSCACIHLEVHSHLVNDGQCLEFLEAITGLIAHKVAKAPSTMFFYDPKFLKFGMFLLVQTLPVLKLLSLKKMGPIYNQACPFSLDDFFLSRVFHHVLWIHPRPTHAESIHSLWNGTQVCQSRKASTKNHCNQWESARNVTDIITSVNLIFYLGLGVIIMLSFKTAFNNKIYNITKFSSCIYTNYGNMHDTSIGKRGMYINCKYLHYIFRYLCKLDYKKDTFIHSFTLNWDEVKQMSVAVGIIKMCE